MKGGRRQKILECFPLLHNFNPHQYRNNFLNFVLQTEVLDVRENPWHFFRFRYSLKNKKCRVRSIVRDDSERKITEDDMPDIELSKTEQGKKKLEIIIDEPVASTIFFRISCSANVIKLANSTWILLCSQGSYKKKRSIGSGRGRELKFWWHLTGEKYPHGEWKCWALRPVLPLGYETFQAQW